MSTASFRRQLVDGDLEQLKRLQLRATARSRGLTADGAGSAGAGIMFPISCADELRANAANVSTISLWDGSSTSIANMAAVVVQVARARGKINFTQSILCLRKCQASMLRQCSAAGRGSGVSRSISCPGD